MTRIIRWQFAFMFAATVIATAGCKPASTDHSQLTAGNELTVEFERPE